MCVKWSSTWRSGMPRSWASWWEDRNVPVSSAIIRRRGVCSCEVMREDFTRMDGVSSSATPRAEHGLMKRQAAVDAILVYYARLLVRAPQPEMLR